MQNIKRGLNYILLNLSIVKLFVYVDSLFANNKDLSLQISFIILLVNKITAARSFIITSNIIYQSLTKYKRVTYSVLASEIYAIANSINIGITINTIVNIVLAKLSITNIPLIIYTNSLLLYECLVKLSTIKEKQLIINIMSLRQVYKQQEVFKIYQIYSNNNLANIITKVEPNKALQTLININTIII